jgi:hypothetical protein
MRLQQLEFKFLIVLTVTRWIIILNFPQECIITL